MLARAFRITVQEAKEGLEELLEAARNNPEVRAELRQVVKDAIKQFLKKCPANSRQVLRTALNLLEKDPEIEPELFEFLNDIIRSFLG